MLFTNPKDKNSNLKSIISLYNTMFAYIILPSEVPLTFHSSLLSTLMAIRFSVYSSPIVTLSLGSAKVPRNNRLVKCSRNHILVNLQTRSYDHHKNNLVFEDRIAGIVCYKDENGEIICEGYDEGPRFYEQQMSRFTCNSSDNRDVERIDLLQRCWLHVADEDELKNADKGLKGCRSEGF